HIKVAVNLSPIQFKSERLLLDIAAALGASGLSPSRLELEITETVMLHDTEATLAMLRQITALGPTIAMDDFGTGYSSLSYLRKFPFDEIKIDRSFVQAQVNDEGVQAITEAILVMCRHLGLKVVAEGVESPRQLALLQRQGCDSIQGF